jgi:hypothetical protein
MNCTTAQSLIALELANAAKTRNAQIKMSIAAGSLDPITVLGEREHSIRVYDVLRAIRGISHVKAERIIRTAGVPRLMRVEDLCGARHVELVKQTMLAIERLEENRKARAKYVR